MGWSNCGEDDQGRSIGYQVDATCDFEGCKVEINRGLSYVCGGMHGGPEIEHHGKTIQTCGQYFCADHLIASVCAACEEQ